MAKPSSGKQRGRRAEVDYREVDYSQYDQDYCIKRGILPEGLPDEPPAELVVQVLRQLLRKILTDSTGPADRPE